MKRILLTNFVFLLIVNLLYSQFTPLNPELVIPIGHTKEVEVIALSNDNKYMYTGSADYTIKLWETESALELRTYRGHNATITAICVTSDNYNIISASDDGTIRIWNVETGKEILKIPAHNKGITALKYLEFTKTIVSASQDGTIKMWNFNTGKNTKILQTNLGGIMNFKITPLNQLIAVVDNSTILKWDIISGKLQETLVPQKPLMAINVVFAARKEFVYISNAYGSVLEYSTRDASSQRTFVYGSFVESLDIAQNDNYLLIGGQKNEFEIWEIPTETKFSTNCCFENSIKAVKFAFNDKKWVVATLDKTVSMGDVSTEAEERVFKGYSNPLSTVAFSPNGQSILSASENENLKLWNITNGSMKLLKEQENVTAIIYSVDGNYALTASNSTIYFWDIKNETFKTPTNSIHIKAITSLAISNDATIGVSVSSDGLIIVWDLVYMSMLNYIQTNYEILSVALSADKTRILTGQTDNFIHLWDSNTGEQIKSMQTYENWTTSLIFSNIPTQFYTGNKSANINLWDLNTEKKLADFKGHKAPISSMKISKDFNYMLSGSEDKSMILWNLKTKTLSKKFEGHSNTVNGVDFSADNKIGISASLDGSIKYWELLSGKELATQFSLANSEWCITTPDGKFDATQNALEKLYYVKGMDVIYIDALYEQFLSPRLLWSIIAGTKEKIILNIKDIHPAPFARIVSPNSEMQGFEAVQTGSLISENETIEIKATLIDNGGGINEVVLFLNEKRYDFKKITTTEKQIDVVFKVKLSTGKNEFELKAINNQRIASIPSRLKVVYNGMDSEANLYILALGINNYTNPLYKLEYACNDVQKFIEKFEQPENKIFKNVYPYILLDEKAVKLNMEKMIQEITAKIKPNDVFILFYSGHGVVHKDEYEKGTFYFVLQNIMNNKDENELKSNSISSKQLLEFSNKIVAHKQMLILDACDSEIISEEFEIERFVKMNLESKTLKQLARDAGVVVFSSSKSLEVNQLKHGILSQAVIEGLSGSASFDNNKEISAEELKIYLETRVKELNQKYTGEAESLIYYYKTENFPLLRFFEK